MLISYYHVLSGYLLWFSISISNYVILINVYNCAELHYILKVYRKMLLLNVIQYFIIL